MKKYLFLFCVFFLNLSFANFSDVSESNSYYDAVMYLKSKAIVQGYEDGSFGVDKEIARAEMAKIISLTAGYDLSNLELCFVDIREKDWFKDFVCSLKINNLVQGYEDNTFRPIRN